MQPDEWVVLVESDSFDDEPGLLYLEAVLQEEGVEALFDPRRPGEWTSAGYGGLRKVRMLVMQRDLDRAKQILADLESTRLEDEDEAGAEVEDAAGEDDEWCESEAAETELPAPGDDPRLATFKPPMDKAINPGCATLLLPAVMALGLLIWG